MAGMENTPGDEHSLRELRLLGIEAPSGNNCGGLSIEDVLSLMGQEFDDIAYERPYDARSGHVVDPVKEAEMVLHSQAPKPVGFTTLLKSLRLGYKAFQGAGILSFGHQQHTNTLISGMEHIGTDDSEDHEERIMRQAEQSLIPNKQWLARQAGKAAVFTSVMGISAYGAVEIFNSGYPVIHFPFPY